MRRPARVFPLLASVLLFLACNGDGNGPEDGGPGGGVGGSGIRATIDGEAWEASSQGVVAMANAGVAGSILITGSLAEGNRATTLTITLYNVSGPGEYPLGVGSQVVGGIALVGVGTSGGTGESWITPLSGSAGLVSLTTVGDGRIAGTFRFTAVPGTGTVAEGERDVTDGRFDLELDGALQPPPEGTGSRLSATLDSAPYYAATVVGIRTSSVGGTRIVLTTTTIAHGLSITLDGFTGPGTYALSSGSPLRAITAGRTGGTAENCCWGLNAGGDAGEVIVTSLTGNRIQGTFSATLKPQPGKPSAGNLAVAEGSFDIGLP